MLWADDLTYFGDSLFGTQMALSWGKPPDTPGTLRSGVRPPTCGGIRRPERSVPGGLGWGGAGPPGRRPLPKDRAGEEDASRAQFL